VIFGIAAALPLLSADIVFAFLYPLSRKKHAQVVKELESRRASHHREVI
jgi:Na+/melibiose symporter-like transporter